MTDRTTVYRHIAAASDSGQRLDRWLSELHPELSRSRIQRLIEDALITVNESPARAAHKVHPGDEVRVEIPPPAPAEPEAQDLPIAVLYEDEELIVVDKGAGMVVHPAAGARDGTLVNALLHRVRDLRGVGGVARPGIVHRLDKDTSGAIVVAKSEESMTALSSAFKERTVEKLYLALVHGELPAEGTFDTLIGRHPMDRKRFTTRVRAGRRAVLHYKVRERFAGATLVEVRLETGRTHQVRVQFADAGHPLLCDEVYGSTRREARLPPAHPVVQAGEALGRQALHAWRLSFPHPKSKQTIHVEAPLPPDFNAALEILRSGGGPRAA